MAGQNAFTDQELVALLKQGDEVAYTAIFERYHSLLYIFAYKRIDNREEAKDVVHDVFAGMWEKRTELQVHGTLPAYLYTVIKNRIFDLYKRKKVTERYLDTFQEYLNTEPEATDHRVRHNDLSALIEQEIAALPEKMRKVFEMSRNTYMSRKEIAAALEISEDTVKSRMHGALKILKGKLGDLSCLFLSLTPDPVQMIQLLF